MFTKTFKQINKGDASIAGGKGASLGEMISSGIPVPDGFVVLSTTFDKFLEITDINIEIDAILNKVKHNEVHTVENASKQIQALILNSNIPEDIVKEIKKEFKKLNSRYVAVRSSATAEDSASAAWAGQLDSFLNTTEDTLLENVKRCFASLFTPRAIFYRFEKKLDKQKISVAVVVQKMVNSDVSGIAFSVHPVTEDYNQIIIEAGFGLGEAIVSGQITPDSYVVTKDNLNILDKNAYTQERGIFRDNKKGGNEWKDISKNKGEKQCLSDKQIIELSELIIKIENHYKFPCDIEWAMENNKFYIVQSRPITTLKAKKSQKKNNIANKFLSEINKQTLMPPQHNSSILIQGSSWNICKYFDQYYKDKTNFPVFIISKSNEGIMYYPFTKLINIAKDFFVINWNNRLLIKKRINLFNKLSKIIDKNYNKLSYKFIKDNDIEKLIIIVKETFDAVINLNSLSAFSFYFDKDMYYDFIDKNKINIRTSKLNIVWELGTNPPINSFDKIRENNALELILKKEEVSKITEKLHFYGVSYGHVNELSTFKKKFQEDFNKYFKNSKEALEKIKKNKIYINQKNKVFQKKFKNLNNEEKRLVNYLNNIIEIRDKRKDSIAKFTLIYYKVLEKLFNKYKVLKKLIYFYRLDELLKGEKYFIHNIKKLQKRSNGYCCLVYYNGSIDESYNFNKNKEIMDSYYNSILRNKSNIKGQSAYNGNIKGIVKIIQNINDFDNFKKGEILVTGMTRPEFVSLMKKSSAIITDEGGITCHAAIVSRELKKPCIIGTKIATQVLRDGDEVELDAGKGVIKILKKYKK